MTATNPVFAMGYGRQRRDEKDQAFSRAAQEAKILHYYDHHVKDRAVQYQGFFIDPTSDHSDFFSRTAGSTLSNQLRCGDHVIIASLRWAFVGLRDGMSTIKTLMDRGVVVHVIDWGIDTSTAAGKQMIDVGLSYVQLRRTMIAEHTRAALAVKRERGLPTNGSSPIGWTKRGKAKFARWENDKAERDIANRIREWSLTTTSEKIMQACRKQRLVFRDREISQTQVIRLVRAARLGFPLPNGMVDAGKPWDEW